MSAKKMFDVLYLVELLTPRRDGGEKIPLFLERFQQRYEQALSLGCGISVPDNPMGRTRIGLPECISQLGLTVDPGKIVMNLNTFHSKTELDTLLDSAAELGINRLLVVRGDGGPELEKLNPQSIGGKHNIVTTPELVAYINREYEGQFITGVAFNPYKKTDFELAHLQRKIEAGAKFVITQPIFDRHEQVDAILDYGVPVVVEAWMSENVALFYKSVGIKQEQSDHSYDPRLVLQKLHQAYPGSCVYLAMLNFTTDWSVQLPHILSK